MSIQNISKRATELQEEGITIIDDYIDRETAENFHNHLVNGLENDQFDDADGYSGYGEMANADVPVANERTGTDEGMIDIFNPSLIFEEMAKFKNDSQINEIINKAAEKKFNPSNDNAYIRRSVLNPQRYHADNYQKYKSFLYLTDVSDESDGPFMYIEGSHNVPFSEKFATVFLNQLSGRSFAPLAIVPDPEPIKATAPKGTLIISNQGGYHQGHPQSMGKERVLLTTSYTPENPNIDLTKKIGQGFAKLFS
jgi:hypothetical protein